MTFYEFIKVQSLKFSIVEFGRSVAMVQTIKKDFWG
jgi:hypothetical protein